MRYIVTALHCEAEPLIRRLGLKKIIAQAEPFPVFRAANVKLCVCGVGPANAAAGTAFLLAGHQAAEDAWLLNLGICGGGERLPIGSVVYPHTVADAAARRVFYPEMLYRHRFTEGILTSGFHAATNGGEAFADMEAAYVLQAAVKFLPLKRVLILKVLSDHAEGETFIAKQTVSALIDKALADILPWLDELQAVGSTRLFSDAQTQVMCAVAQRLRMTYAMNAAFKRACEQLLQRGEQSKLDETLRMFADCACVTKQEGKIYFAELQKRLLE